MLPDFPRIKEKILKGVNDHIRKLTEQDSFMSTIKAERHFEGNKMLSIMQGNEQDETEYKEIKSSTFTIKKEDVIAKGGPSALLEHAAILAEEIKKQKAQLIFDNLNAITEKTGNVTQGKGELNPEILLEALDKIQIDFDENGNPSTPSLIVSPEMHAKLQSKIPEWDKDEDYKKKYQEIINRKRKEWNDRESHRKLVD